MAFRIADAYVDVDARTDTATRRIGTLISAITLLAPAAQAGAAAVVAGTGAMAAGFGAAGLALGAFGAAVKPQFTAIGGVIKAFDKAQAASALGGKEAAAAQREYAAALAKLPPATRQTAVAFLALRKDYKAWSDSLSGDTMPIFTKGIQALRILLPKLTPLVKTAARALSDFMDSILKGVKSKGFDTFLARTNEAAGKVLPSLLNSLKNVGKGLAGMFSAFLPHAPGMASWVERLTAKFAAWGQSLGKSESFKTFIAYVRANLPALSAIFINLVTIIGNLAQAFAPLSGISLTLIQHFTGMLAALPPPVLTAVATAITAITLAMKIWLPIQRTLNVLLALNPIGLVVLALAGLALALYTAYQRSATFRTIVQGAWQGIQSAASTAWAVVGPILINLKDRIGGALLTAVKDVARWFGSVGEKARTGFTQAQEAVASVWNGTLSQVLFQIVEFFRGTFIPKLKEVADGFKSIGDKAVDTAGKIGGMNLKLDDTKKRSSGVIDFLKANWVPILGFVLAGPLGLAIGLIIKHWRRIKDIFVEGIVWLGDNWRKIWNKLVDILSLGVSNLYNLATRWIQKIVSAILSPFPDLQAKWNRGWGIMVTAVQRAGDRAVSWLRGLPGKLWRALGNTGSLLYNAGKNVIQGLINGMTSMINRAINTISNLASRLRGFLPGSPAKEGPFSGIGAPEMSGRAIVADLTKGILSRGGQVEAALNTVLGGGLAGTAVAGAGAAAPAAMAAGVTIHGGITINISGTFDLTSTDGAAREIAVKIRDALRRLERGYL